MLEKDVEEIAKMLKEFSGNQEVEKQVFRILKSYFNAGDVEIDENFLRGASYILCSNFKIEPKRLYAEWGD